MVVWKKKHVFGAHYIESSPDLYNKWPVHLTHHEIVPPVTLVFLEHGSVEHGRVAQLSTVPAPQHPPRQFWLVYHRGHDILGTFEHFVPQLKTSALTWHDQDIGTYLALARQPILGKWSSQLISCYNYNYNMHNYRTPASSLLLNPEPLLIFPV